LLWSNKVALAAEGGDKLKPIKATWFILTAGIFILIFSTLLGASIVSKYNEINGFYKTNKVSVNILSNKSLQGKSSFTQDDIRHLQQFSFKDTDMAYAAESKSLAVYGENQTQANVLGVSDKYEMFHQIRLESGSFITSENRNEMVAVVDKELAIALFNNTNIIGMYIDLYDQRFRIIGVIDPDMSIIQTLADNGYGNIYMPVEHMLEYDANSKITSLEFRAASMGTTGKNVSGMTEALASIGKDASNYKIIDYNIEKILLEEKALFGIFIPGIGIIIMLLLLIKKRVVEIYAAINSALKENYFKDAIKLKYIKPGLLLLEIITALLFVYLVWDTVKFSIYIPTEYVPDELIDIGFFSELFKSLVQNKVQSAGYIPSSPEMKANVLSAIQSWNLYVGVLAGFPLYFLGLRLLELRNENTVKRLLYCCTVLLFSIILGLFILGIFNMPIVVNTKGVLIVFAFVFLSAVKIE